MGSREAVLLRSVGCSQERIAKSARGAKGTKASQEARPDQPGYTPYLSRRYSLQGDVATLDR
jgi:hypothetical protein